MEPDSQLLEHEQVEFLNESLDAEAYGALLDRSDFVVLPYRSESYHQRLSRVAIEAAGKGIPLIYTLHTWTQEVVDLVGCGVPIQEESVECLVDALHQATLRVEELKSTAMQGTQKVCTFHTADTFREQL